MTPLQVLNRSGEEKQFELHVESLDGSELTDVTITPKSFSVGPGRSKTIRAMLRSNRNKSRAEYGLVRVKTKSADGEETITQLPLAMFYGEPGSPLLTVSPVQLSMVAHRPVFSVTVDNNGDGFVPVDAQLVVASAQARRMALTAGYGRWIKPGESFEMRFVADHELEPGEYQLALRVQMHQGQPPIERTVNVRLTSSEDANSVAAAEDTEVK